MPRIAVIIPAHNERDRIAQTLSSLTAQERPPDLVLVVADNCTDDTAIIAEGHGATVFATTNNNHKKAGALNQALDWLLPRLDDNDFVLIADADTELSPGFITAALAAMSDSEVGAVGGVFYGEHGNGLIGMLQRNEYHRYSRELARTGRVWVLTGTASMFRMDALHGVMNERGKRLPGVPGKVYDTAALTEDNELTLAIKSLGWRCISPSDCHVTTELMPTWGDLWRQRMRWQRGAIENLRAYGWTSTTRRYWGQQLGMALGVLAMATFFLYLVLSVRTWTFHPFWTSITGVFVLERTVTVRRGGWRAVLTAAPLVIEVVYDLFLQAVLVTAYVQIATRREAKWHHVNPQPTRG